MNVVKGKDGMYINLLYHHQFSLWPHMGERLCVCFNIITPPSPPPTIPTIPTSPPTHPPTRPTTRVCVRACVFRAARGTHPKTIRRRLHPRHPLSARDARKARDVGDVLGLRVWLGCLRFGSSLVGWLFRLGIKLWSALQTTHAPFSAHPSAQRTNLRRKRTKASLFPVQGPFSAGQPRPKKC